MYHALAGAHSTAEAQDPHYTVSANHFDTHLDTIVRVADHATSARDWLANPTRAAVLTFDDGHLSNYTVAWPALQQRMMRADFFVNPANVGRPGFATWTQLREMAGHGMSIQSHGWDHRYFTELGVPGLREDLTRSRQAIEDAIGQPVTLLAPPGGRMPPNLPAIARECGYHRILSSRPGRITRAATTVLARMAVTASLDAEMLAGWLEGRGITTARLRYETLAVAKRALGNRRYEHWRARLLGSPRDLA